MTFLDGSHQVISYATVSTGTANATSGGVQASLKLGMTDVQLSVPWSPLLAR
jgi:DNA repair protein RadC